MGAFQASNDNTEGTPFNMAMLFYIRLDKLLTIKAEAAIRGDLFAWYNCLREIYRIISFKIKNPKSFEDKFKAVKNNIELRGNRQIRAGQQLISNRVYDLLDQIDMDLTQIMDKEKMIFPKVHLYHGLDNMKQKLGLTQPDKTSD